jgi:hypothetical protein
MATDVFEDANPLAILPISCNAVFSPAPEELEEREAKLKRLKELHMNLLQQLPITNITRGVPVTLHRERSAEQPLKLWQRMYRYLTNWTDTQMRDFLKNVSFAVSNIVIPTLFVYYEGQFLLHLDVIYIGLCENWRMFFLLFLVYVCPMVKEMMMMKLTQAQVQTLEPPAKDRE